MPNIKSAKKRMRQNEKRRMRNRFHLGKMRSAVKRARKAMEEGDSENAPELVRQATKQLDHAASKGVIHKNKADRTKSRLMKQLNTLDTAS